MNTLECPVCDLEFEAKTWHPGKCPGCGNEYYWDEQCTEDYSDCWPIIDWENYSKPEKI